MRDADLPLTPEPLDLAFHHVTVLQKAAVVGTVTRRRPGANDVAGQQPRVAGDVRGLPFKAEQLATALKEAIDG